MPFLVPNVLTLAIPLDSSGVLLPVLAPVVRVAGAPFLRTVQASLAILRVRRDFLTVVIGAPAPLTVGLTAHELTRLIFRWLEAQLTVAATPFDHTGVVASTADGFQRKI